MSKAIKIFRSTLIAIMCVLTAMNVIAIVAQVILRFLLKVSIAWVSELAGVSLVWITFLGASLATLDESNINFNGLIDKLSGLPRLLLKTLVNLLIMFLIYILIRYGYKTMMTGFKTSMVALPTTLGVCVSVIPASGVFMALATVLNIIKDVRVYLGHGEIGVDAAALYDDVPEEVMERAVASFEADSGDEARDADEEDRQ